MSHLLHGAGALFVLAVAGCAASATGMRPATKPNYVSEQRSTVVFVRDSRIGSAINFPIVDERREFVGNVRGKQHAIAELPAGAHTFYVLAENVEPVHADLLPGRMYIVETRPRMGWGKSRVTAEAVKAARIAAVRSNITNTTAMEPDAAQGKAWVDAHRADIETRIASADQAWAEADPEWKSQHTLSAQDSIPSAQFKP